MHDINRAADYMTIDAHDRAVAHMKANYQAAIDAVLNEAIWAMEALQKSIIDYWSEALATDESALCVDEAAAKDPRYQYAQTFLASPAVRDYRARQERS